MRKTLVLIVSINLLLIVSIASVNALELDKPSKPSFEVNITFADIYVDDDAKIGGDGSYRHPFQSIQDGIDAASTGDTVFVLEGIYYENVVVNKPLTLIGQKQTTTIINGGGNGNVLNISSSYVTFKKFSVENSGASGWPAGITVWSKKGEIFIKNIYIKDCIIRYNCKGILHRYVSECTITNCHIHDCEESSINFKDDFSENILIDNCILNNNGKNDGYTYYSGGIVFSLEKPPLTNDPINIKISNCKIFDNEGNGIDTISTRDDRMFDNLEIFNNNIYRNTVKGISIEDVKNLQIHNNHIYENELFGIMLTELYSLDCSYNVFDNIISCNGGDGEEIINAGIVANTCIDCVTIKHNTISSNTNFGVLMISSTGNKIIENNFINNKNSSSFIYDKFSYSNKWDKNYWDKPRYFPYPVYGMILLIPWVEFDWHPAKTPYSI